MKVFGVLVADGGLSAALNITMGEVGGQPTYSGPVTVTVNNLQLPDGIGFDGTMTINLNSAGTTMISTTSRPARTTSRSSSTRDRGVEPDGSVLINTTTASTVGDYAVTITNLKVDADVCQTGAIGGR